MKKNILAENMRRFRTKNLNEQFGTSLGSRYQPKKTTRSKKEFQLDISTVNIGDVLEAFETDPNKPIGRGTVVSVDNSNQRVELSDIEYLSPLFKNRGSKSGFNRIYKVGGNGKLNGFKIIQSSGTKNLGNLKETTTDTTTVGELLQMINKIPNHAIVSLNYDEGYETVVKFLSNIDTEMINDEADPEIILVGDLEDEQSAMTVGKLRLKLARIRPNTHVTLNIDDESETYVVNSIAIDTEELDGELPMITLYGNM
jgi:hypothetical protein